MSFGHAHPSPSTDLRWRLLGQILPAVAGQHRLVRAGGRVEGDLLAHGLARIGPRSCSVSPTIVNVDVT